MGSHEGCSGLVDGDLDRSRLNRGEPCGCGCHAETFDPSGVHPEKHPAHQESLEEELAEWRAPTQQTLDLAGAS